METKLRRIAIAILLVALMVMNCINFKSWIHPDTGTSVEVIAGGTVYPSVTMCPFTYFDGGEFPFITLRQNKTFAEIMQLLPSPRSTFQVGFLPWKGLMNEGNPIKW